MEITFSPIAGLPGQSETTASVSGDVITVDGAAYDLSAVPEGGFAEPGGDHPFVGKIERSAGEVRLRLVWFYNPLTADPTQPNTPPVFNVVEGAVPDPIVRKPLPIDSEG